MRLAYVIILLYLCLPFAGLYTISDKVLSVYNLNIKSVYELRQAYPVYLLCFGLAFMLPFFLGTSQPVRDAHAELTSLKLKKLHRVITIFLVFAAVFIFLLVGKAIFSGQTHRGEVRVSFGGLGFLYKTFVQFWVPASLALSGILYRKAKDEGIPYKFPIIHLILTMATLSMMGYKSGIIVGIFPFLIIIFSMLNLGKQITFGAVLVLVLILYSTVIIDTQTNVFRVAEYLFYRATEGTAWGLIACWELFPVPDPNALLTLTPIFGARITASLLGIAPGTVEYAMLGGGQYVTYLVHPNPSLVLAGETNLTITLAGEGVYLLGRSLFWILAFPVGFVTGIICKTLRNAINHNQVLLATFMAIFLTNIILPLLNSGGLISLVSAFNVFYMLATFIFLKLIFMMITD